MTAGHQRALLELRRLNATAPETFELLCEPTVAGKHLVATISIRLGHMEMRDGGLDLREREDFVVLVPADFPFEKPSLGVTHDRFAGFPHVIWSKWICLYQSSLEWNPSDGLFGFFDRLHLWLSKAAINDMDPVEGPLEPPHHLTDTSQSPFVIRCDAPVQPGESWIGFAGLVKHRNRTELVSWHDLHGDFPEEPALTVILPHPLPMEFPQKGADFFRELSKQEVNRSQIIRKLAIASLLTKPEQPIHLVLGVPMRRAADGSPRLHIAVWTTDASLTSSLQDVLSRETDTPQVSALRAKIEELLGSMFESGNIHWCQTLDDRPEIIVRRDNGTAATWFAGKRVLILGCGALGSWTAEIIARANAKAIHLVDSSIVKPGLLARQNYRLDDIGGSKAAALAERIGSIASRTVVSHSSADAHTFIMEDFSRFRNFDCIVDCTASTVFQMKLERDWSLFEKRTPPFVSFVIDGRARHCLVVRTAQDDPAGVWSAYFCLRQRLSSSVEYSEIEQAFFSEEARTNLFQPEPGCSDPTFSGSTADIMCLASTSLNAAASDLASGRSASAYTLSAPNVLSRLPSLQKIILPDFIDATIGSYRVRLASSLFSKARGWVRQNNRLRSRTHETGGLLWGCWDDSIQVIWIFDLSGPPIDSLHDPGHFLCGIQGSVEEHHRRMASSRRTMGFVGYWHTHPDLPSSQSSTDIQAMSSLVSSVGQNQKRSVMMIFGRTGRVPTAGIYLYESQARSMSAEFISVGSTQIELATLVV